MSGFRLAPFLLAIPALLAQTPGLTTSVRITLPDALLRAREFAPPVKGASLSAALAREDTIQTRASTLPTVSALNQFIYTEGNRTPSGVFVANDGVHVYNEQAVVHQELLPLVRHGEINRARAAEAVAKARIDIAARGLDFTVTQNYFGVLTAERKLVNAQSSLTEANQFLDVTRKLETGGEAAHADVIKAQITEQQRERDVQDSQLAIEKAKIALSVLIFPDVRSEYDIEDVFEEPAALPPLAEVQAKASATSPDLAAAKASVRQSEYDVGVARYGYLPSFSIDFFYGIDANQFAARTDYSTQATGRSTLPDFQVNGRQNLGFSGEATLTVPVWNWGSIRSKVKQASIREDQAKLDLSATERTLQANLATFYREAQAAEAQLDSLRGSTQLSEESLRLTTLRYNAGEATVLEVVDAQTTLVQARNAYEDGLARYRLALAEVQTLTGR